MDYYIIDLAFQGRAGAIAAFLVSGDEGHFLIECGPESTFKALEAGLADHGVTPSELKGVFVTHIHLDHAGAAGKLAAQGVPIFVHPKGTRHLVDPERLVESAKMVYGEKFEPLWGGMTPAQADLVHPVEDGERVEVAGLTIEAIETPGHAFHHHSFAIGDTCFAGDAAGAAIGNSGFLSVTSAPPQFHLEHTLASIDKLAERHFSTLYLTHFGAIEDPDEHLDAYREAVELNVEFVRMRLEEKMESEALQVAYEAFNLEQAFRFSMPPANWETLQSVNGTGMCADGIRLYWEKRFAAES